MRALPERARWIAALCGPLLFQVAFFMPLFGGGAKQRARCEGREFTGQFDDCFNDYIPILEVFAPLVGLALLYLFARFAFALWAPEPDERRLRWRLASRTPVAAFWPELHLAAAIGAAWATWRASTYAYAIELWPFTAYWIAFAAWFAATLWTAWPRVDPANRDQT